METILLLKDRFEALLPFASAMFPEHGELLERFRRALKFGHVDGFEGWKETVDEWSHCLVISGQSVESLALRSLARAITAYAAALSDSGLAGHANASLDSLEDLLSAGEEIQLPRLDLRTSSPADELQKHLNQCRGARTTPPVSWYLSWLEEGCFLVSELKRSQDPIFALGVLDTVLSSELPLFLIRSERGYAEVRQRHGEALQLFITFLNVEAYEIICPVPQEDLVDFSLHELTDQTKTGWGARVERVKKVGLARRGQVIRKAVVEPLDANVGTPAAQRIKETSITDDLFKGPADQ